MPTNDQQLRIDFLFFTTSLVRVLESGFLVVVVGVGVSFSVGNGIANFLSVGSSVNATLERISSSNCPNESTSKIRKKTPL